MMSSHSSEVRFLTREHARRITDTVLNSTRGGGLTKISMQVAWYGAIRWAQNSAHTIVDTWQTHVIVQRVIRGAIASFVTNRIDPEGLRDAVARVEARLQYNPEVPTSMLNDPSGSKPHLEPPIWSDATLAFDAAQRGELTRTLIEPARSAGFVSAGELKVSGVGRVFAESSGVWRYYPTTIAELSMTVRDPKQAASGWAGVDHHDWTRIDPLALNTRAIEKCHTSASPRAVEPGRYTAILEPQAVCDLIHPTFVAPYTNESVYDRTRAEQGGSNFSSAEQGFSKIGERVIDPRLTLKADPMDPDAGFVPFDMVGNPYKPVDWIKDGVLRNLSYDLFYALQWFDSDEPVPDSRSFRLEGNTPPVSVDEMIATTKRGILVTRFTNVQIADIKSMLLIGYTRDGIWLIENGKITSAVRNFRFSESPFFMLNNVDQIGESVRVFRPEYPGMAPALKVRDFNFVGLADAV